MGTNGHAEILLYTPIRLVAFSRPIIITHIYIYIGTTLIGTHFLHSGKVSITAWMILGLESITTCRALAFLVLLFVVGDMTMERVQVIINVGASGCRCDEANWD